MTLMIKGNFSFRVLSFILLIVLAGFINNDAISQEEEIEETLEYPKDTINLSDLSSMINSEELEVIISDKIIVPDKSDDEFLIDKIFFSEYHISQESRNPKKLYFYNCEFNFPKSAPLTINNIFALKLNIIGCSFRSAIYIDNCKQEGNYPIVIENCFFDDDFKITNPENQSLSSIKCKNNEFASVFEISSAVGELEVLNSLFLANVDLISGKDQERDYYQLKLSGISIEELRLIGNRFDNSDISNVKSLSLNSSEIGSIYFYNNSMVVLDLSYAEVGKSLLIDSLFVDQKIGILNFDFPEANTNIPWYNLGGEKLAVFHTDETGQVIAYQAKTDKQLSDNLKYNDLISAYTKFNTLYHDRGDITSANSSYVEIKDIETRRQAYIQKVKPTLNNYINYNLNLFLKFFSDYATNPGKSLKLSLWVILIFTVLYMLSFYRWDGMNYSYYVSQFNKFYKYISTNKPIDEVFEVKKNEVEEDIEDLRNKYLASDKKVPKLLWLFGNPLHFLGKFRYQMMPNLIKLFNFQPKEWKSYSTPGKIWSGSIILFIGIFFIFYVLLVKLLNSFVLSINSFFVIGFGALPEEEEGIAMYLSIIEGIIGWFLLTIFTITLLSQVLQSA